METRNENSVPFKAVHPGGILKEELKSRGIKQVDFARRIGMQPSHLSALLNGKRNISPELAGKLEKELDIPATMWLSLQDKYELDKNEISKRDDGRETITLTIPAKDHSFIQDLARRFGWACMF